jgi:hypothetical protein
VQTFDSLLRGRSATFHAPHAVEFVMSRNSASVTPHSAGPRIGRSSSRFFSIRPSQLVIEGGQPPLLKITVWLGNKAADKYRLAPLFGRADVGKIPHGHRWDLPRSEFAPDSRWRERDSNPRSPSRELRCSPHARGATGGHCTYKRRCRSRRGLARFVLLGEPFHRTNCEFGLGRF